MSKCGKKTIWHWAHTPTKHCDPWWKNETLWHRNWKNQYPADWQEIVHFDSCNGEKHIADIKTDTGQVIEFQNSPISSEELEQREAFYGDIIWVVNGEKFEKNFHILHKLPDSKSYLVEDVVFFPRRYNHQGKCFFRRSENPKNATMVILHGTHKIQDEIDKEYSGHHLYDWIRPRTVWYESSKKVYIDFGGELLWNLQKYDDRGLLCVQAVIKQRFIYETTGDIKSKQNAAGGFKTRFSEK
jgi:competence CoiA-like predicted nuclease